MSRPLAKHERLFQLPDAGTTVKWVKGTKEEPVDDTITSTKVVTHTIKEEREVKKSGKAVSKAYSDVVNLNATTAPHASPTTTTTTVYSTTWYCDICSVSIDTSTTPQQVHKASTVHQFSLKMASGPVTAGPAGPGPPIPRSNLGYRLLRGLGWESGSGLGKTGQGITDPVPVEEKHDRSGIRATDKARERKRKRKRDQEKKGALRLAIEEAERERKIRVENQPKAIAARQAKERVKDNMLRHYMNN